ncbi:hypothetical protein ACWIYZ_07215 [Ursidibacter arcticus]
MKLKLTPIAFIILATSLTACSGGSNKSTPVAESPRVNIMQDQTNNASSQTGNESTSNNTSQTNNDDIEYALDPTKKVKWRQLTAFLDSGEPTDPLKNNGQMAQMGAAAYINGDLRYSDNGTTKDLRKSKNETNYDPSFLTKAENNPDKLQHLSIKNKNGQTVVNTHFVNQKYSSYLSFKSEIPVEYVVDDEKVKIQDTATSYIAVPTQADKAILDRKVKATYKGHTIGNQKRENNQFTLGDITLDADFEKMQISGEITKRNDELLRSRAKIKGKLLWDRFTTDPKYAEESGDELISQSEMAKREEQHRTLIVKLLPTDIKIANGVVSFENNNEALEFKALNGDTVKTGSYAGIFAGPNAEEVVGEIKSGQNFISFGATEVQK